MTGRDEDGNVIDPEDIAADGDEYRDRMEYDG